MIRRKSQAKRWLPRGIGARGILLILIASVSVTVSFTASYAILATQATDRMQAESQALLAALLSTHLENAPEIQDDFGEWLTRIEQHGRRVRWAGLFNREGIGLEFRRRTAIPQEQIVAQLDYATREPSASPLLIDGTRSRRFELLTIPLNDENAIMALILDRGSPTGVLNRDYRSAALVGLVCLGVAGVVGACAGFYYSVERPMRAVGRQLARVQTGLAELRTDDTLPAEFAGVLEAVNELQKDLEKWRSEASYWRQSVETAVDARTRRASQAQKRAERQAETDSLTRLANRRVLERELPKLYATQRETGGDLTIVVIDVDRFKQLNDTCGHPAGDELLSFIGDLLRACTRKGTDLAVRYGGDEFVLALPGTGVLEASKVARRIVGLFDQRVRTLHSVRPGLSVGVASLRKHGGGTWEHLLKRADEAMYWAKQQAGGVATAGDLGR